MVKCNFQALSDRPRMDTHHLGAIRERSDEVECDRTPVPSTARLSTSSTDGLLLLSPLFSSVTSELSAAKDARTAAASATTPTTTTASAAATAAGGGGRVWQLSQERAAQPSGALQPDSVPVWRQHMTTFPGHHATGRVWRPRHPRRRRPRPHYSRSGGAGVGQGRSAAADRLDALVLPPRQVSALIKRFSEPSLERQQQSESRTGAASGRQVSADEEEQSLPALSALALLYGPPSRQQTLSSLGQQTSWSTVASDDQEQDQQQDQAPEPFRSYKLRCRRLLDSVLAPLSSPPHPLPPAPAPAGAAAGAGGGVRHLLSRERLPSFVGVSHCTRPVALHSAAAAAAAQAQSQAPAAGRSGVQSCSSTSCCCCRSRESASVCDISTTTSTTSLSAWFPDSVADVASELAGWVRVAAVYELCWALLDSSGMREAVRSWIGRSLGFPSPLSEQQ